MKRSVRMALALILCMVSFVGCGLNSKIDIMFSKVGLDASLDDVIESYGESDEIKKDDITGNTVYSYPCDYSGQDGKVSFEFAEDGHMEKIEWKVECPSQNETEILSSLAEDLKDKYGKPEDQKTDTSDGSVQSYSWSKGEITIRAEKSMYPVFVPAGENVNDGYVSCSFSRM